MLGEIKKILEKAGGKITGSPCILNHDNVMIQGLEIKKTGNILVYYSGILTYDDSFSMKYKGIRTRKLKTISDNIVDMIHKSLIGEIKHWKRLTKGKKVIQLKLEL